MRSRKRPQARLGFDRLESRWCLTAQGQLVNGTLTISDDLAANITINEVAQGTFVVYDGSTPVGNFAGVSGDLNIGLSGPINAVRIDFQGQALPGNLNVVLGNGNNNLVVGDGGIGQGANIVAGSGQNQVIFGDAKGTPVQVNGQVYAVARPGAGESFTGLPNSTFGGLNMIGISAIVLSGGSAVLGNAVVFGSVQGTGLALGGTVGQNVLFYGSDQADAFSVASGATIQGNLVAALGAGDDTATMAGTVGGLFYLDAGAGNNNVSVGGNIGSAAVIFLGDGSNTANVSAVVGAPGGSNGTLILNAGAGNDTVTFTPTAEINGVGAASLGAGADVFVLQRRTDQLALFVNGGPGVDTFVGNFRRLKFPPINFEILSSSGS